MVSAIYIIAIGLGAAFLIGMLPERQIRLAYMTCLAALGSMSWIAGSWLWAFSMEGLATVEIITAGTKPPFAINFKFGLIEATLAFLATATGLLSALYMKDTLFQHGRRAMAVLSIFIMALCGIIFTRDMFNLFVFIELIVISTGGLVLLSDDKRALGAGFKYLIVSQLVSILVTYRHHLRLSCNWLIKYRRYGGKSVTHLKRWCTGIFPDVYCHHR